jgi:hypothetical protein
MDTENPDRGQFEGAPPRAPEQPAPRPEMPASPAIRPRAGAGLQPGDGPPSPDYPVRLEVNRQERYSRLLPFVKWLLAIPHYIVLFFLYIGVVLAGIAAFFAVLFTGKYPAGIFSLVEGTLRWTYRVGAYIFLLTDAYPPFSLDEDPNYPVRVQIERPERIANWRPLVQWLLSIPYYLIAYILQAIWIYLIVVISFFAILFTGKLPQALFDFAVVAKRWNLRSTAYIFFLTDKYPPFVYG